MLRWCAGASTVARALPPALRAARGRLLIRPCSAKKPANNEEQAGGGVLSKSVLLRSGVALFALGFVDAGYSGDWSRIGAISKDTEELLKLGAYVVVPLFLALIFSVSEDNNES
ncbi:hypothetical protein PR202_gb19001 [Eleusine coracana subsp. coracana]|uniref:DUF7887 domain-containing protein n=1 Tax=Eleusine coracana subsp. coracana TaxID=191504 RepID=A0AAV5F4U5_ELECO|nr:hypothetical protein QOZ80_3BG0289640 [Eleusine coracana subsp. coracana]GJN30674.1 hypothetical protein PR202_gb19001 [Eleusine coracana subsp. coracana]